MYDLHQKFCVLLVVAFCSQILERWWGSTDGTFLFYECRLSGGTLRGSGDTQTLPTIIKFV